MSYCVDEIVRLFAAGEIEEMKSLVCGYIRCVDPYQHPASDEAMAVHRAYSLMLTRKYFEDPPPSGDMLGWKTQFAPRGIVRDFLTETAAEFYCENANRARFHNGLPCSAMVEVHGRAAGRPKCSDVPFARCGAGRLPRMPNVEFVFSIAGICNNTGHDEAARRAIREELLDENTGIRDNATALIFGILTEKKLGEKSFVTDRLNPLNRFLRAAPESFVVGPQKIDSQRFFPAAQRLMRDAQGRRNLNLTREKVRREFVGPNGFATAKTPLHLEGNDCVAASTQAYERLGELFDQIFS